MTTKASPKAFNCRGCGARKIPDGTPQNAPFVWTDEVTKTRHSYCYECDGLLIQDALLSKAKEAQKKG